MGIKKATIGAAICASVLLAPSASADHHKGDSDKIHPGKGQMKALEKRSERAAERSNAQWREGAKRGQDRASEVRELGEQKTRDAEEHMREKTKDEVDQVKDSSEKRRRDEMSRVKDAEEKGKEMKDRAGEEVDAKTEALRQEAGAGQAKAEPSSKARGFWSRLFGRE